MVRSRELELSDEKLREVFSYPRLYEEHYRSVIGDLLSLGVEKVLSSGDLEIGDTRAIGKGCTGVVCMGVARGAVVALKILRSDSAKRTLEEEGENLKFANSFGVGPKVVGFRKSAIAMEIVRGVPLLKWLEDRPSPVEVKRTLVEVLNQCRTLDENGLDHGELSDSRRHIMIEGNGRVRIIDFESASRSRSCQNLTSVVSYLFLKGTVSELLRDYFEWKKDSVIEIMKRYKKDPSELSFRELIDHLKLY